MDAQPVRPTVSSHPLPQSAQWALAFLLWRGRHCRGMPFGPVLGKNQTTDHRIGRRRRSESRRQSRADAAPENQRPPANQIMATRDERGGFDSVDDLRQGESRRPGRQESCGVLRIADNEQYINPEAKSADKSTKKDSSGDPVDVNRRAPRSCKNCRPSQGDGIAHPR